MYNENNENNEEEEEEINNNNNYYTNINNNNDSGVLNHQYSKYFRQVNDNSRNELLISHQQPQSFSSHSSSSPIINRSIFENDLSIDLDYPLTSTTITTTATTATTATAATITARNCTVPVITTLTSSSSNSTINELYVPSLAKRLCERFAVICINNITCICLVLVPIVIASMLICIFVLQDIKQVNETIIDKDNLHSRVIYAFMIFSITFLSPFALFFIIVIVNKIYTNLNYGQIHILRSTLNLYDSVFNYPFSSNHSNNNLSNNNNNNNSNGSTYSNINNINSNNNSRNHSNRNSTIFIGDDFIFINGQQRNTRPPLIRQNAIDCPPPGYQDVIDTNNSHLNLNDNDNNNNDDDPPSYEMAILYPVKETSPKNFSQHYSTNANLTLYNQNLNNNNNINQNINIDIDETLPPPYDEKTMK